MSELFKMIGMSAVSMVVCAMFSSAGVAQTTGRAGYANVRAGASNASLGRMPTMPTLPIISVGNISTNIPTGGTFVQDLPDQPDQPDQPDVPDDPEPEVVPECPDGGVRNSAYTVDMCMDDVLHCVNNGALPNGLNNLFNKEVRYAVENGMGLCISQVERCIREVRRDCAYVYRSPADVWIDFNSRKVQPEYYNFVLRKTGLTPNQAENTCRLLDKNTYGSSFSAVANDGKTTAEYNKTVGAYNGQQGNVLIKSNPQGVEVNDGNPGVDGSRGHYARWDAETATCLIRVAAYNKDKHISNSWLFGAAGDDKPAEVWVAAGETFSCNKDLFGFSLMNDTSTVAVVGIGGGTVLGAGIGAIAGHGKREFDCSRDSHREMLMTELKDGRAVGILNEYLEDKVDITQKVMEPKSCDEILGLFDKYYQYETAIAECNQIHGKNNVNTGQTHGRSKTTTEVVITDEITYSGGANANNNGSGTGVDVSESVNKVVTETEKVANSQGIYEECMLKALNLDKANGTGIYCFGTKGCVPATNVETELKRLNSVFSNSVTDLLVNGEKSNMAKSIGIGAAVGAGTGGLATAITAFVERNNINCRVADGLEQVALNKSHSIDTLKDFYVKWNLRVPDVVAPTAMISDCQSWKNACATFTDLEQCAEAQFNYKPAGAATTTLVRSACKVSGSACIENYSVARSYGACE